MNRSTHHVSAALLTLLLALTAAAPAAAQLPADTTSTAGNPTDGAGETPGSSYATSEGLYAIPIGNPTIVWEAPSRNARILARLDSADVALQTIGDVTNEGETFEKVQPRSGSGLSWEEGYVLASEIKVNFDRPRQYSVGAYGALAFSSAEPSTLSLDGGGQAQNPFGEAGRSPMVGIGLTLKSGKYIPPGDAGLWLRLDLEGSLLQSNPDAAPDVEDAVASMLRIGVGGEYVYQASPNIDLFVGGLVGGGPVSNELTLENEQTLTAEAVFGTADALVGIGFGRNAAGQPGTFRGLRVRLEGGYRFGQRLGDWSFSVGDGDDDTEDEEVDGSLEAADADQALSLSGPVLRLVVGF